MPAPLDAAGRRFNFWLGQRAKRARELRGLSLERVAGHVGHSKETLDNFEKGLSRLQQEAGVVAGYAELCEITDPRDIYAEALRDWYDHGDPPEPKRSSPNGDGPIPGLDDLGREP